MQAVTIQLELTADDQRPGDRRPAVVPVLLSHFSDEPGFWCGSLLLAGVGFHVDLLRVADQDDLQGPAHDDPYDRYDDFQRLNEGRLTTVTFPELEGEYLLMIYPYAD